MCKTGEKKQILSDEFRPLACFCGCLFATRRRSRKAPNEFALNIKKKTTKQKKKKRTLIYEREARPALVFPPRFSALKGGKEERDQRGLSTFMFIHSAADLFTALAITRSHLSLRPSLLCLSPSVLNLIFFNFYFIFFAFVSLFLTPLFSPVPSRRYTQVWVAP